MSWKRVSHKMTDYFPISLFPYFPISLFPILDIDNFVDDYIKEKSIRIQEETYCVNMIVFVEF